MRKYVKFRWLTGMIIFIICVACLIGFSMEEHEELNQRLGAIRSQKRQLGEWADWGKVEAQCLELIKDYNSPGERGKIYTTIASIYSQEGWHFASEDPRIPKAIKYCKEALKYPLEVTAACEMHGRLAGAMLVKYRNSTEEEFVKIRQEAIVSCLTGLRLALDHNAPKDHPEPPPPVGKYDSPDDQELMNKHKQQLAARKEWQFLEKLYFQRKALTQRCLSFYSHKPYATDEFKLTAEKILKEHEGVAKELVAEVQAEIARKEEPEVDLPDPPIKQRSP
jgi:hypothetical protein